MAGESAANAPLRGGRGNLRRWLTVATGATVGAGFLFVASKRLRRAWRTRQARALLDLWTAEGPATEPVVDCEVPVSHGQTGEDVDWDTVEVPIGLLFECERLRACLQQELETRDSEESLLAALGKLREADEEGPLASLKLPWVDLAALAQLTYWYDRRPRGGDEETGAPAEAGEVRQSDAKFGRWTKKVSREKVVYGTVALRYRTRGHLGQEVFRRPAGVDVTRLTTLRRAAALCGHGPLLDIVEETMEKLKPKNVAKIPWEEVSKHTTKDDLWLLIDGRVYDVTPFLDIHPGGGQLIVDAAGKDATALFELTHGEGLRYSLRLLNQFFIGVCQGADQAPKAVEDVPTPEFMETLRSITGALHTFDEAKATGEAQGILR